MNLPLAGCSAWLSVVKVASSLGQTPGGLLAELAVNLSPKIMVSLLLPCKPEKGTLDKTLSVRSATCLSLLLLVRLSHVPLSSPVIILRSWLSCRGWQAEAA